MYVILQECNKLIKTTAKSILLTEKKKSCNFSFGYLFCSVLRLKAENSQPKVPAQRLADHISWNNFDKVMTWSYGLEVISLHKNYNTWQEDTDVFSFFHFFEHLIWRRWGGKEINRAILSQMPIQWYTYFLKYDTFPFSLLFFILPSSPVQYFFLSANCLYSQWCIYKLSDLGGLICFHGIESCAVGG